MPLQCWRPGLILTAWLYHILFIHLSVGRLLGFFVCLLWRMLLWTFVYKFLCGYLLSFFSGLYLGVELLGMAILCFTFCVTARVFYKAAAPFNIPTSSVWGFEFSLQFHQHLLLFIFPIIAILVGGVSLWLFICILVMVMMLSNFQHALWPFLCFFWRNVCSNPLPIIMKFLPCLMTHSKTSSTKYHVW